MPYYFFDRCPTDIEQQLADLAQRYELQEVVRKTGRQWQGSYFKPGIEGLLLVIYSPTQEYPLQIQIGPNLHHSNDIVRGVLRTYIDLCKPTKIDKVRGNSYDLKEFT